jgi:hypothetical protein
MKRQVGSSVTFGIALSLLFAAGQAYAATVTFTGAGGTDRLTSAAEVANGAPDGWIVRQYRVSASTDILRVGDVKIMAGAHPWNSPVGMDNEPPNPAFLPLFPSLGADSWITTPGATAIAGNTTDPLGSENNSWFDTTSDGPTNNFVFAQLTLPPGPFTFTGVVSVLGPTGDPEVHQFNFPIPEPAAATLIGLALASLGIRRRR